ncbi:MAG: hypothetical protein RLW62_14735 [Gammaproteobacteria bacterium]
MSNRTFESMREEAAALAAKLRTERDELRVQLHLAGAEARAEWEKLEPRLAELETRAAQVGAAAGTAAQDVGSALGILGEELAAGYARIRRALKG